MFRAQSTCTPISGVGALRSSFDPSGSFEPRNPCGVSTCMVLCQRKAVRLTGVCTSVQTTQTVSPYTAPRGFVDARRNSPRSDCLCVLDSSRVFGLGRLNSGSFDPLREHGLAGKYAIPSARVSCSNRATIFKPCSPLFNQEVI